MATIKGLKTARGTCTCTRNILLELYIHVLPAQFHLKISIIV